MTSIFKTAFGLTLAAFAVGCSGSSPVDPPLDAGSRSECYGLADGTDCGDPSVSACDLRDSCLDEVCVDNEVVTPPGSQAFDFTGASETYTVPCGVDTISIDAYGAQGGASSGAGGLGGRAYGDLVVSLGDTLEIFVGGEAGTFNGGGAGGSDGAGVGGGASDVRFGGVAPGDRIVVAGGGGGGGALGCVDPHVGGDGGGGGGLAGGNGADSPNGGGGFGGTLGVGGEPGIGCTCCLGDPGLANGTGGNGEICCCDTIPGGGGGGAGYVDGGGGGGGSAGTTGCAGNDKGGGGGGAGGSNYTDGLSGTVGTEDGVRMGDGQVIISW